MPKPLLPSIIRDVRIVERKRESRREPLREFVIGVLVEVNGSVLVTGRPDYVWCREYNQPEGVFMALNRRVAPVAGLMVKVGWNEKPPNYERQILGVWDQIGDIDGYEPGDGGVFNSHPHAQSHQYPSEANPGIDPVLIYQPALQQLKGTGNGIDLIITVQSLIYRINGVRKFFGGGLIDLTPFVPAVANMVCYVLIYLNGYLNILQAIAGTAVPVSSLAIPQPLTPPGGISSCFVKLVNGQTAVTTVTDILDARAFLLPEPEPATLLGATQIGQIMYSTDGITMTAQMPLVDDTTGNILIDDTLGIIIVEG